MDLRVLIVSESISPYVQELREELDKHVYARNSISDFLNMQGDYTVIHFQWPEEIFRWKVPDSEKMEKLKQALEYWKKRAILVLTRHNAIPNVPNAEGFGPLYRLVYGHVDAVIHLGDYSFRHFDPEYFRQDLVQRIIPHHMYVSYPNTVDRREARRYLRIPERKQVILCFGRIRSEDQRELVLQTFERLDLKDKLLLMPRYLHSLPARKKPLARLKVHLKRLHYRLFRKARLGIGFKDEHVVQYYFKAADVVLLPRTNQLNSGVIFLACTFGSVVVGPDCQNIGEMLRILGNPVFDPADSGSILRAIKEGLAFSRNGKGPQNRQYAEKHFSLASSVEQHLQLYRALL